MREHNCPKEVFRQCFEQWKQCWILFIDVTSGRTSNDIKDGCIFLITGFLLYRLLFLFATHLQFEKLFTLNILPLVYALKMRHATKTLNFLETLF